MVAWLRWSWPWLAVFAMVCMTCWPLVATTDRVFVTNLKADSVITPWFYDLVARDLLEGNPTDRLSDFNFPSPLATHTEFPSVWDARLFAPLAWLLDWPRQWGAVQSMAVLLNACGVMLFARGLGASGPGLMVAGALATWSRPIWKDLAAARMNSTCPGLALGALGLWLLTLERGRSAHIATVGAVLWGVAATLVYPPYVALLIPVGALAAAGPLLRASPVARLRAVGAALAVGLICWAPLQTIIRIGTSRVVSSCDRLGCPNPTSTVTVAQLTRSIANFGTELQSSGTLAATWWLLPVALLAPRRRVVLAIGVWGGILTALSLGPCPMWDARSKLSLDGLPANIDLWYSYLVCKVQAIHDYNRLLSMAALLAAGLIGLGIHGLARRGWLGWLVAMVVCVEPLTTAHGALMSAVLQPHEWQTVAPMHTVAHQRTLPPEQRGPILELPFDQSAQFLSVLEDPSVPRANPLREQDPPPSPTPFWRWTYAVARGEPFPSAPPTASEVAASGVRWMYFDEARCMDEGGWARIVSHCGERSLAELRAVLGPERREGSLHIWDVAAIGAAAQ